VVRRFLGLLQAGDVDAASRLLAPNIRYINVSLPTIRANGKVRRALRSTLGLPGAGFEVHIHSISAAGETVLTERTEGG
jgi:limonene-1,2-epoxide hydrolase